MSYKVITINGTNHQLKITAEQAALYNFIAADSDGELWLYERKPAPDSFEGLSFDPGPDNEFTEHDDCLNMDGVDWMSTITPINIILDPDAMAEAVRSLIATRLIRYLDKPDFKKLLEEVTELIKAGN